MQRIRRYLPILVFVGLIALTMVPTVFADGSGGPQGGSNSGGHPPPPPPPPDLLAFLIWLISILFGLY